MDLRQNFILDSLVAASNLLEPHFFHPDYATDM
jgi:hypothetical protein